MAENRPPSKHHYIPEFYLKQWVGDDGRLVRFDRPYKEIVSRRVYPSEVEFEHNLYRIPGVSVEASQQIEANWFRVIDDDGARSLQRLLSGNSGWDSGSRTGWSRFMLSIVHRTPENLAALKEALSILWEQTVPEVQDRWDEIRMPSDPARYEDFAVQQDPNVIEKAALRIFPKAIDHENIGYFINNMRWEVVDVQHARFELLTSDCPLIMSNGLKKADGHIAMPISPTKIFVAVSNPSFLREFSARSPTELVRQSNIRIVDRARRFVAARTLSQASFVERRFGSNLIESWPHTFAEEQRRWKEGQSK